MHSINQSVQEEKFLERHILSRLITIPMTPQIRHNNPICPRQRRNILLENLRGSREAVELHFVSLAMSFDPALRTGQIGMEKKREPPQRHCTIRLPHPLAVKTHHCIPSAHPQRTSIASTTEPHSPPTPTQPPVFHSEKEPIAQS